MRNSLILIGIALALAAGCAKQEKSETVTPTPSAASSPASIENRDWDLVAVGEKENPLGNGGKPATLRFDAEAKRAGGNSGCNRYSASYRLSGDSLTFGPAISTKMACEQGMELEAAWLGTLEKVVSYSATESTLTLHGEGGPLARLTEHPGP